MPSLRRSLDPFRRLTPHCRADEGSVTLEYVLWMPVWAAIIALAVDATVLLQARSELTLAARDLARQVAIGVRPPADAEQLLETAHAGVTGFDARVTLDETFVTAAVSAPFSAYTLFSGPLSSGTVAAQVTMRREALDDF